MPTRTSPVSFELWLEFEHYARGYPAASDDPRVDYCNAMLTLPDGTSCGLNVWTFGYLSWLLQHHEDGSTLEQPRRFLLPPDLLVEVLDRASIEQAIRLLLRDGVPPQWQTAPPSPGT